MLARDYRQTAKKTHKKIRRDRINREAHAQKQHPRIELHTSSEKKDKGKYRYYIDY